MAKVRLGRRERQLIKAQREARDLIVQTVVSQNMARDPDPMWMRTRSGSDSVDRLKGATHTGVRVAYKGHMGDAGRPTVKRWSKTK